MKETAQQYLDRYKGQSLLYAPRPDREYLRGECVQGVCIYVTDNGYPVMWADAYYWKNAAKQFPDKYEWIENTPNAVPQPNDIMIWLTSLPGSGNAGHIAACIRPLPGTGTFISADQNWGGRTVHQVTHNYNYVAGWLRFKSAAQPAPQPKPQGDEMIADANQAHLAYKLLRPNGDGSDAEINATAGKRSWVQFASDAKAEVASRDANITGMQNTINGQNERITALLQQINEASDVTTSAKADLTKALAQIANDNAELATLHDQITSMTPSQDAASQQADQTAKGLLARILDLLSKLRFHR